MPGRRVCKMTGSKFDEIREHFSVKNEGAFFAKKRNPFISDRFYAITPTGLFETGLFYEIVRYIRNAYPDEQITLTPGISEAVKPQYNTTPFDEFNLKLRPYQLDAVANGLKQGRGIIKLGTGGGKTLTISSLITSIYNLDQKNFKCLLIVPDLTLVNQTYNDFIQYGVKAKVTRWTGNLEPDFSADIIIANTSILLNRYDENKWIFNITLLVVDECHKLRKDNKICNLIKKIKTNHRYGLTGTLPESKADQWKIVGLLGDIFYEKSSYELKIENYLTNATVNVLNIMYKEPIHYPAKVNKFRHELQVLYSKEYRNKIISTLCKNFKNNILILINHIAHGQILFDKLSAELQDKRVYFIRGEVEVDERARVIQEMETNDNVVCVAISAIFSTGVNIKNLHMIVFASGGKSFIRTIQSIGRGLRLNPNKQKLTIIDLADRCEYSIEHSEKRKDIYTQEKIQFTETTIVEK